MKDVVGGEVELAEGGINHMVLELVGTDYEPEKEGRNRYEDNDGDDDFEEKAEKAAAAAASAASPAVAVVGS